MKTKLLLGLCLALSAINAHATLDTFTDTVGLAIPDGNVNGLSRTLNVSGVGYVESLTVTLDVSGGYNGALYAYLSYNGTKAVLLNRVGRTSSGESSTYGDTGFLVTLGGTGNDIHNYQTFSYSLNGNGQLTGNWQADGRNVNPVTVVNTDAQTAGLDGFNGFDPNGTWTIFFSDVVSSGDPSTLNSWSLEITSFTPVPEPTDWALGFFAGAAILVKLVSVLRRKGFFA